MKLGELTETQILTLAKLAYEEGDAGFRIVASKSALIVVDMQDEFVKPHWTPFWVPEATRQIDRIKTLIKSCREREIFLSFLLQVHIPISDLTVQQLVI